MENEKYNKVLNILRKSKPVLFSTEDIEREVINKIKIAHKDSLTIPELIDFLFGWVYVGWVRRTLIAASVILVVIFIYQQSIILRQIDFLSRQTVEIDKGNASAPADEIQRFLMKYKNAKLKFPSKTMTISERQMKELLEYVQELQIKYKDLEKIIEDDPELKELIDLF